MCLDAIGHVGSLFPEDVLAAVVPLWQQCVEVFARVHASLAPGPAAGAIPVLACASAAEQSTLYAVSRDLTTLTQLFGRSGPARGWRSRPDGLTD